MVEPADRRIGTYSKGMRSGPSSPSALVHDPAVLLLDEPFNGVDPRQRLHLMDLLRRWAPRAAPCCSARTSSRRSSRSPGRSRWWCPAGTPPPATSADPAADDRPPVQYVVVSDDDRALASALIAEPSVVAGLARRRGGVDVVGRPTSARSPTGCRGSPATTASGSSSCTPTDESLESVFAYLVGGDR